ncbi:MULTISPECIES: Maf family protein [unclassified Arsukibacterium]|uniref:Maf family protein n=1 Tax=unclassified Arsukibacterium TaxID=2635278 RepID=UPI000C9821F7|nr:MULTISPECIES: Maf family protein [unclassified Arsukibacterium]MAA95263.1 septum formation inhibitor Maf [Rheinheimera sp.]HAW93675.1 septum formation inhibitor Maf [Candidatus Azambacteria bacterium]|tara:strand:+ start:982 stop:1587 length:606 start_codon:yes stop_codon:yes gene_type:complete
MNQSALPALYLASTSVYRRQLLAKLTPHFTAVKPETDETPFSGEDATALVRRLARAKAQAVANTLSEGLVIGSDQVAVFNGQIIGKPHTVDNAIAQLSQFSGHSVTFLTGLALINATTAQCQLIVEPFTVSFRILNEQEIAAYVAREQPLDCAGSFKSEGLGISLFSALRGDDPNSLIGLPLIKLLQLLRNEGVDLLTAGY